ncbi:Glutathione S-transferase family protein [Rhynchospora pubera]|uniref:glutathione transferase n=1 Tax=Rhynchospora pubera TaxID=906938 RepID=A0AAV8DNM8_9POAL|nr:Glutathione S-transferase family protein [Rhynchospora pubera]KAJ4768195.1 Glutathione S-transferase family protein [Rhynchospora pubera]
MGIKVYDLTKTTNVARVLISLEEVGADYEVVPVDFATGEPKSQAHLTRNPFGQVPAFQDDDDVMLFESRAISRYILRKYKSDLLREDDIKEAALVDVWVDVEYGQYNAPASAICYNVIVKPMHGEEVDQQVVDTNLEKLKKVLEVYEARLSQYKYLAGDFISFADLSHVPCTYYLMLTQYKLVFDSYPHVKAWWEAIIARPSIKKVFDIMSA